MNQYHQHEILDAVQPVSIGLSTTNNTAFPSATPSPSIVALPILPDFDDEIALQQHRRHSIEIGNLARVADNEQSVADIRKGTERTSMRRKNRTYGYADN